LGIKIVFLCPRNIRNTPDFGEVKRFGNLNGHAWEQIELPLYLQRNKITGLINLCNSAPLYSKNQVVTVHDLAFARHPEWFDSKFAKWYNWMIPRVINRAKHVLTVSEFSKSEIVDFYGTEGSKVSVIPNGIYWDKESIKEFENPIKDKYILAVGSDNPRKNYDLLIRTFEQLEQNQFKLVIVGSPSKAFSTSSKKENDKIVWLQNVDNNKLKALYKNAHLLVSTSFYEGFGLPILEALELGCPVLANGIEVFKEIYKDSINYYQENSESDLHLQLKQILESDKQQVSVQYLLEMLSYKSAGIKLVQILGIT
tara:strand:+ start:10234 stop:11169 length:936 start_codon:yes stop_codon:yes gene_type:complete